MVPYDRFTAVLDACTLFPMLARDVLLTLAAHEFFSPKWSARISDEWTRNLLARKKNPPWAVDEIVKRLQASGLVQTSLWLNSQDVSALM